MTSLAVPSSCVVTQTPMGTNSGTRRRKRKFPLLFVNCDRGRIEIDHLYGQFLFYHDHNLQKVVPAASGRATAGTTRAVLDCSTNHSSADRIVVNSYTHAFSVLYVSYQGQYGIIIRLNHSDVWPIAGFDCRSVIFLGKIMKVQK